MRVGTKSLLFGAHQFLLHPLLVAAAWRELYGFPWDLRLWVAFFVHDLGYWGCRDMDGREGEGHVELGARIMHWLFDRGKSTEWRDLCLYHSRFRAKQDGRAFSRLCVADKFATILTPAWLYLPLARLSGELDEYMGRSAGRWPDGHVKYAALRISTETDAVWYEQVSRYLHEWVREHRDGRADRWT